LRNDVQLKAEEVMQLVNDLSSKIIEEIDEYEKERIEYNKENSKSLSTFNNIIKELESFHTINTQYLKQYEVDDAILINSIGDAKNLIKKVEFEIENLKDVIFNRSILKFEKNNDKVGKSILGSTKLEHMIDSLIILNRSQMKELMSLCQFTADQNWDLIYRASRDGFEASSFHSKCDDKPNTLVINGIACSFLDGPIFGGISGKRDIFISGKSNLKSTSYSKLGQSFIHPDYLEGSNKAKSFLAGSHKFQVEEIEVYTKQ